MMIADLAASPSASGSLPIANCDRDSRAQSTSSASSVHRSVFLKDYTSMNCTLLESKPEHSLDRLRLLPRRSSSLEQEVDACSTRSSNSSASDRSTSTGSWASSNSSWSTPDSPSGLCSPFTFAAMPSNRESGHTDALQAYDRSPSGQSDPSVIHEDMFRLQLSSQKQRDDPPFAQQSAQMLNLSSPADRSHAQKHQRTMSTSFYPKAAPFSRLPADHSAHNQPANFSSPLSHSSQSHQLSPAYNGLDRSNQPFVHDPRFPEWTGLVSPSAEQSGNAAAIDCQAAQALAFQQQIYTPSPYYMPSRVGGSDLQGSRRSSGSMDADLAVAPSYRPYRTPSLAGPGEAKNSVQRHIINPSLSAPSCSKASGLAIQQIEPNLGAHAMVYGGPSSSAYACMVSSQQPAPRAPESGPNPNNRKLGLYKTELCRSWEEKRSCRYGSKCQFAHGDDEIRGLNRHPKYKTDICRTFWMSGSCPYGKRCCFIHTSVPGFGDATPMPAKAPLPSNSHEAHPESSSRFAHRRSSSNPDDHPGPISYQNIDSSTVVGSPSLFAVASLTASPPSMSSMPAASLPANARAVGTAPRNPAPKHSQSSYSSSSTAAPLFGISETSWTPFADELVSSTNVPNSKARTEHSQLESQARFIDNLLEGDHISVAS